MANAVTNPTFDADILNWTAVGAPDTLEWVAGRMHLEVSVGADGVQCDDTPDYGEGNPVYCGFDYEVVSGVVRVQINGWQILTLEGSGRLHANFLQTAAASQIKLLRQTGGVEVYFDNFWLEEGKDVALATNISLTVRDGKGEISNPSVHIVSTTILDDIIEYAQQFATLVDAVITGEIIAISATIRVALPGGLDAVAANSDVEEGAMFIMDAAGGVKSRLRVPTFDEAMMVSGSKLVDLTDADVIALVGILEDGYTTTTPTDVDTVEYREADIEEVTAAYDAFTKSR